VGVLLTVGLAGLRSKEELLTFTAAMIKSGLRISPQLQAWLNQELENG
jgi:hypothetical protein